MAKKVKSYDEAELIKMFGLTRLVGNDSCLLMRELTNTTTTLNEGEQYLFDRITEKMNFIAFVLLLGHLTETLRYKTYYESTLEGTVDNYFLKVKADMMVATGILERPEVPYFYFQEYKKLKDPKGDVTAQLLEAFLIAQTLNNNNKPLYGCTVSGKYWEFMVMENRKYCISKSYDCTDKEDLLQIIAIIRNFKEILETKLLD
jgi:hypothetical protein